MAFASIVAWILVAAASLPAREFDLAAAPDLCSNDPARVVRPDSKGVTARYIFQLPAAQMPQADAFFSRLDRDRFAPGLQLQIDSTLIAYVETRLPARTAEQVWGEVKVLCGLRDLASVKLALFERIDAAALKRGERVRLREARRRAAMSRKIEDAWRNEPINGSDIEDLLRSDAEARAALFGPDLAGLKLGRLHKADCIRLKKDKYTYGCAIGLPVLKDGEPQYLEFHAQFERDGAGKVHYVPEEIVVID